MQDVIVDRDGDTANACIKVFPSFFENIFVHTSVISLLLACKCFIFPGEINLFLQITTVSLKFLKLWCRCNSMNMKIHIC